MKSSLTAAALVLATTALAACGGGPRPGGPGAPRADSSGTCLLGPFIRRPDGSLTRADMEAGVKAAFAAADANGDGRLDNDEVTRLNDLKTGTCDVTPFIDWSGTGVIGPDVFGARYVTAFDQADVDTDGVVTAVELQTTFRKPKRPPRQMPTGEGVP
jgi:hypothetical protein